MKQGIFLNSLISLGILNLLTACTGNRVSRRPDWGTYFRKEGVSGSFMLYDNGNQHIDVYHLARARQRFLPGSSFNIVTTLIGLETGTITDTAMVVPWDGILRWNRAWNQNLSLGQAFRVSSLPYFQEIARRIGRVVMKFWLDSLNYGNTTLSPSIDSFWLDNSLKISPDEELGLIRHLYFSKLPVHDRPQRLVRDLMLQENTRLYQLSYQGGLGVDSGRAIAWISGWEVENQHPYFFVLNAEAPESDGNLPAARDSIFRRIMRKEGFFRGRK